jgi:hypothetical protein
VYGLCGSIKWIHANSGPVGVARARFIDQIGDQILAPGEIGSGIETKPVESLRKTKVGDQERIRGESDRSIARGMQCFRKRRRGRWEYVSGDRVAGDVSGHGFRKWDRRGDSLMRARVEAGHQRRHRGFGVGRLRNRAGELRGPSCERVDRRCGQATIAARGQVIGSKRIDRHEQDVGTPPRRARRLDRDCRTALRVEADRHSKQSDECPQSAKQLHPCLPRGRRRATSDATPSDARSSLTSIGRH